MCVGKGRNGIYPTNQSVPRQYRPRPPPPLAKIISIVVYFQPLTKATPKFLFFLGEPSPCPSPCCVAPEWGRKRGERAEKRHLQTRTSLNPIHYPSLLCLTAPSSSSSLSFPFFCLTLGVVGCWGPAVALEMVILELTGWLPPQYMMPIHTLHW